MRAGLIELLLLAAVPVEAVPGDDAGADEGRADFVKDYLCELPVQWDETAS